MSIQSADRIASTLSQFVDKSSGNSELRKRSVDTASGAIDKEGMDSSHDNQQIVLEDAIKNINSSLDSKQREVVLAVHEESGKNVVRVIERGTKKVIRQFPPEQVIDTAMKLKSIRGMLFEDKV